MITIDELKQIMPNCKQADLYIDHIRGLMPVFGIDTPLRAAAFLAQIAHESSELSRFEENLNYSESGLLTTFGKYFPEPLKAASCAHHSELIANLVYANRMGNGDEHSGDGWRYHGRGAIQLTGRDMYQQYQDTTGQDVIEHPDVVSTDPATIVHSAMWYWDKNNLNKLADISNFRQITIRINGGTNGYNSRLAFYEKAKEVLHA